MVNFVVCDDNKEFLKILVNIIDKEMMKNKISYKCHEFTEYNTSFFNLVKQKMTSRIYILDIEVNLVSGIDVARKIREKDFDSIIIFVTSHEDLGYTILKNEFMFLSFISKFDDFEGKLRNVIRKAIDIVGQKKLMRFESNGIVYTIPYKDILYITRDSVERKSVIYTDYSIFKVNKSLLELKKLLSDQFRYSHRSCIVNLDRVVKTNFSKKEITFDNGMATDLVTVKYRKEVENR